MKKRISTITVLVAAVCAISYADFVDNTEPDANIHRARIKPTLVKLEPGQKQQFRIIMSPRHLSFARLAEDVKWSVNAIPGGSQELGTIDETGLYRAPAEAPARHEINICAEVPEATNRYLFATVLLGDPDELYKLDRLWGESAEKPVYLGDPHGMCLDADGNLLIADMERPRIMRFTTEGEFLGHIGSDSDESASLSEARAVVTDTQKRIWVCHQPTDRPRLHVYSPDGRFLHAFAQQGVMPGQILRPHGLVFDSKGRLFVVDVDNFRVGVYSQRGEFLYGWGKQGLELGEFNAPHGIMVDPSDDVFVSNYYGPTQKFDADGKLLFAFAYADPPTGPVGFHSISGDRYGNVYMTVRTPERYGGAAQQAGERQRVRIAKYNNNGDYITAWPLAEPEEGASWLAIGDDDTVYCISSSQKRVGVQVFVPQ